MTEYEAATLFTRYAALALTAVQCGLLGYGIYAMMSANRERAIQTEAARRADSERHAEAMAALAEQRKTTDAQIRSLDAHTRSLESLIADNRRATDAQIQGFEAMIVENRRATDSQVGALDAQARSLEAVFERVAPGRDGE